MERLEHAQKERSYELGLVFKLTVMIDPVDAGSKLGFD
jgi:hypothetical protein